MEKNLENNESEKNYQYTLTTHITKNGAMFKHGCVLHSWEEAFKQIDLAKRELKDKYRENNIGLSDIIEEKAYRLLKIKLNDEDQTIVNYWLQIIPGKTTTSSARS